MSERSPHVDGNLVTILLGVSPLVVELLSEWAVTYPETDRSENVRHYPVLVRI